jgi:class I fructose-bisphosphate aldolase/fructose-bisphosphate aldolase/2-amino-3,7-dideoxy-D-threo-hept-6-ulosonate synthase
MFGKKVRIERMRNAASGRIFTVAVDHAPSYGVLAGIEDIQVVIDRVAGARPDAMVLMKGVAERCFQPYAGRVALILKCSTLSPYHATQDIWVSSVDQALRLGADAIAMALTVGCAQQAQLLSNLGALVREAEQCGLPVIVHSYPNGELVPPDEIYTVERVGYASRLAMELGVDIVKTFYTGSPETFAQVVQIASPALVVAAGGPRLNTDADVLGMAYGVVQAGAAGITFGRNIWQSDNPAAIVGALKHILHEEGSVESALDLLAGR